MIKRYKTPGNSGFRIGKRVFYANRCPWQIKAHASLMCDPAMVGKKYGWGSGKATNRFGGGWSYKFGIMIGGSSFILDWGWGSFCTRVLSDSEIAKLEAGT